MSGHSICWSMKLLGRAGGVSCMGSDDEGVVLCAFGGLLLLVGPDIRSKCRRCFPYSTESPFLCGVTVPMRSSTAMASSINRLMLGASPEPSGAYALMFKAKHAAKEIIMAVLFGIDCSCDSPWIAALITLRAADNPAVRKKMRTSTGAVG